MRRFQQAFAERLQKPLQKLPHTSGARAGAAIKDAGDLHGDALHRASVDSIPEFWETIWDFTGVIGERGERTLIHEGAIFDAHFFPDAKLNFAENLLRRSDDLEAIVFADERGTRRRLSYKELNERVGGLQRAMRAAGVKVGDRVAAYLPNLPETIIVMLAASSLGAVFSSSSPDFGVDGVLDRFGQIEPTLLFASDGYLYNGKAIETLEKSKAIHAKLGLNHPLIVVPNGDEPPSKEALGGAILFDDFLHEATEEPLSFEQLPFNHPLYILYSSGTTGKPKCIVHGQGGTLLQHLKEHRLHTRIGPLDRFFYFTTCGWMMWNWLVSGLASEATLILFDGNPLANDGKVLFELAERESIAIFGTSAKFIDAVHKGGIVPKDIADLSSIRTILSTGSPLSPESFDFVYDAFGKDIHLASISGGTDVVSCFVLGDPTLPVYRGEIQCAGLGMDVQIYSDEGKRIIGEQGELVCASPFPSMPIGFFGDDGNRSRYRAAYFERFKGVWCHGDFTMETERGGFIITGRSDAILNPGGVRIGTAEIYNQCERIPEIVESVVIGQPYEGDVRVVLFVVLQEGLKLDEALEKTIRGTIREHTSPRHVPAKIVQVPEIPRTRSGKISELTVRDVVMGRTPKNLEALANPESLEAFRDRRELAAG